MRTESFLGLVRRSSASTEELQCRVRQLAFSGGLSILLFAVCGTVAAQSWVAHGPGPKTQGQVEGITITDREVVGAIHDVAPHPSDANTVYVGAVNGGIWKTTDAMVANPTWEKQTDFQESLSIGALEFDPTDATNQTLVAGTGRFSSFGGRGGGLVGLLRTTDDGATWTAIDGGGTLDGLNISGVAPRGSTIIISVNADNVPGNQTGIWRSLDPFTIWTQISGGAGTQLPAGRSFDLVGDPTNSALLFTNAGTNGLYRSTNTGATWAKVSNAAMDAFIAGATNVEIAVGTNNNVYVAIVNGGRLAALFRSGNGNSNNPTWTPLDTPTTTENFAIFGIHPGGQGGTHLSIAVDPTNSNIVYVGGDRQPDFNETLGNPTGFPPSNSIGAGNYTGRLFRIDASQPAGSQAAHLTHSNTASTSSPHADSRDMAFAANGNLIEVDDGGIYRRTNPQANNGDWFSMNGDIQTTEFHSVAWDAVSDIVIGGTQDNGVPEQSLPSNSRWRSVRNADGGNVAVDDFSTPGFSNRYSSVQNLGTFRRRVYDAANVFQSQVTPGLTVLGGGAALVACPPGTGACYPPIKLNTADATGMRLIIGASNSVYESLDQGQNIREIGPGISVNRSSGDPIAYGATDNLNILYVGSGSQVFVRTAANPAPLTALPTYPGTQNVSGIAIDPNDSQTAFVVDAGSVRQTPDTGAGWNDITGNLPTLSPGNLLSIAYSTSPPNGAVIVGADASVFIAFGPTFLNWHQLGIGLPTVPVYELEYDAADNILLAGTLGRGAWTISMNVAGEPQIQVPGDVYLGDYCVGSTNIETLEVCNTGKDDLVIDDITSSSGDFAVTTPSSGYPVVISHDFCFPFEVVSTPATDGPLAGTLTIASNDPLIPSVNVDVTGTGMECVPQIQVPGDIYLGDYCVDDTNVDTLEVCNTGKENLSVDPIISLNPDVGVTTPSAGYPVVISPDFCFPFEVVHSGTTTGAFTTTLSIPSDDPINPVVEVDVTGTGNVPDIRVTGSTDFGITSAWQPEERTVAVCNIGQCGLSVLSATVDCADFALLDNPFPATLEGGGCLDLVVQFTPELPGLKTCELTITSDDPDTPIVTRTLTARTPPAITFHTGFTHPYGRLNNVAGRGPTFNLGFLFPLVPELAWDVRLGFANFDGSSGRPDRDVWSVGANLKYTVNPASPIQLFLNGGPDVYHFDPGNLQLGFNVGLGLHVPINKIFSVEATYNYHNAFTASPLLHFDLFQVGFVTSF